MSNFPVSDMNRNAVSMGMAKALPDLYSKLPQCATSPRKGIMSFRLFVCLFVCVSVEDIIRLFSKVALDSSSSADSSWQTEKEMVGLLTDSGSPLKTEPISISFASQHLVVVTDVSEWFQCPCPNRKCTLNDTHGCVLIATSS